MLSYVEPYASSACEMVAEVLQYIGDNVKIRQAEADAMYAGIVVMSLLGLGLYYSVDLMESYFCPWMKAQHS